MAQHLVCLGLLAACLSMPACHRRCRKESEPCLNFQHGGEVSQEPDCGCCMWQAASTDASPSEADPAAVEASNGQPAGRHTFTLLAYRQARNTRSRSCLRAGSVDSVILVTGATLTARSLFAGSWAFSIHLRALLRKCGPDQGHSNQQTSLQLCLCPVRAPISSAAVDLSSLINLHTLYSHRYTCSPIATSKA